MFRQTAADREPFPPRATAPAAARYHRAGDPWPLYASIEEATAWAERAAANPTATSGAERRRLHRLRVDGLGVLDLRDARVRERLGVSLDDLTAPPAAGWAAPQRLAAAARDLGAEGLIAPSAARPGAWNVVVFPSGFGRVSAEASDERSV